MSNPSGSAAEIEVIFGKLEAVRHSSSALLRLAMNVKHLGRGDGEAVDYEQEAVAALGDPHRISTEALDPVMAAFGLDVHHSARLQVIVVQRFRGCLHISSRLEMAIPRPLESPFRVNKSPDVTSAAGGFFPARQLDPERFRTRSAFCARYAHGVDTLGPEQRSARWLRGLQLPPTALPPAPPTLDSLHCSVNPAHQSGTLRM